MIAPLTARIAGEGPAAASLAAGACEHLDRPLRRDQLIRRMGWWGRDLVWADALAGVELLVAAGWLTLTDEGMLPGPRHQAGRRRSTTR
jgi:hypothetical protein